MAESTRPIDENAGAEQSPLKTVLRLKGQFQMKDVKPGVVFSSGDKLYLRVDHDTRSCVDLDTYKAAFVDPEEWVDTYESELIVK